MAAPGAIEPTQSSTAKQPFPHRSHVPAVWYGRGAKFEGSSAAGAPEFDRLEVARDCRGCHDFGSKAAAGEPARPASSPMSTCAACHYDDVIALDIQPGFESGLREGRGSLSAFDHSDHGNLACRQCHAPPADPESQDFGGETGVPACVKCHTKGGESLAYEALAGRTIDTSRLRSGFLAWLNADPSMTRDGRGPYPHSVHLRPAELTSPAACTACHADVSGANADDLHTKEYTAGECARCHVQSNGDPVQVERAIEARPSVAARTFSHADHLAMRGEDANAVTAGSRARIDERGCLACHEHAAVPLRAPDGAPLPPTFVLRDLRAGAGQDPARAISDYQDCLACHDVPRFRAENHGAWDECSDCHSFGDGDARTTRPADAVDRIRAGDVTFLVDAQAHPGLTPKPEEDCASCHRAALPALPSRVSGKRFEHASHLGRDPADAACKVCHPSVPNSVSPAGIGRAWSEELARAADLDRRLTFDPSACNACHPGLRVDPSSLDAPKRRDVVRFAHADHVGKALDPRTGETVRCTTCHEAPSGERGRDVGVRPDALVCTACHQHDDAHAGWTGGISASGVASCEECHVSGIPRVGEPPVVDRARVALRGPQHHPDDRGCWECHVEEPPGTLAPVTAVLASFPKAGAASDSQKARSPHRRTSEDPNDRSFYGPRETCQSCHWAILKNQLKPDEAVSGKTRAIDGNSLQFFPGGKERVR